MDESTISELFGNFTWDYGREFFIRTDKGNFIWSDPEYPGGTNELRETKLTYKRWLKERRVRFGRSYGMNTIGRFCKDFILV